MPINTAAKYRQTITYWAPGVSDGYGITTYSAPTTMICRWEQKAEELRDPSGEMITSMAKVYLPAEVDIGGYIFLGTSAATDPSGVEKAYQIRMVGSIPDLRNLQKIHIAYL